MMVQDQYSGYIHEVPDQQMGYGLGEVVYDGFGNAVGWNPLDTIGRVITAPFTAPISLAQQGISAIGNLARGASNVAQGAGNIIGQAAQLPFNIASQGMNAIGQGLNTAGQAIGNLVPPMPGMPMPFPGAPFPTPGSPGGSMYPYQPPYGAFQRPHHWPTGWVRPNLPYTGLGPQRMYMRCAVWPGPSGLVPGSAANMPPGSVPGLPGLPGMPGMPGLPMMGGGRRRRRRRR
jgi:hypothetical protein